MRNARALLVALLLVFGWPPVSAADGTVKGKIEASDRRSWILVAGRKLLVRPHTVILTPSKRKVAPAELVRGVEVEVEFVSGSAGEEATAITAYVLR
ncbi:MAG: hypothetical protein KatS3mg076_1000 [Candidatus Binatia bacterium]|nr:MAG: hypothetical protein KatS3mg076_1000 [Candidatus Binatia bacterium]